MLFSSACFPNIHYFSKLINQSQVDIEACENYQKQSYRNRFDIYGANGLLSLSMPIIHGRSPHLAIKDARLSYDTNWQKIHFKSVESAYRHSPFYEFFIDDLLFVWHKKETFLLDLNHKILQVLLEAMDWPELHIHFTQIYQKPSDQPDDWRYRIHPKIPFRNDEAFRPKEYQQIFMQKNGFQANLSILDALFQLGPETRKYVNDCVART